ncbi:SDR family oxidoreductase [Gammaproteobacteria bacterium]|nr:SDR family oxidoreductase [Gammaproteobacteria bacterium]MDB2604061.1 SDR family oxidoreductase [Gammaproteobacteria bacterium]
MTLENKLILITGGARDIGRAISKNLAKNGANLAINFYGSLDEANSLENELKEDNIDALFLQGDMTSEVDVKNFIDQATTKFGTNIHGLVNVSGGLVERRTIDQMDLDFLNKVMNLNFNSSFLTIKYSLPFMSDGSSIVNFASQAGRDGGGPGASAYASSKGAVMTFTRSMAKELGPKGIRVNALCPGMISTTFHDNFTKSEVRSNVANATPLKREGTSDEIALIVKFLLSNDASFLTGVNLDSNGGLIFS